MSQLKCGIVGLPNVGKSMLFNLLTSNNVSSENYPFCTIDPNVGIVNVPDDRVNVLAKISKSQNVIFADMMFVDIAGLVKGASQGEGLGNKFLAHVRNVDSIVHVVRCFDDDNVIHVNGSVDPIRDIDTIDTELLIADLQVVENALQKIRKNAKSKKSADVERELYTLEKVEIMLGNYIPLRNGEFSEEEEETIAKYQLLTKKKVIYLANTNEKNIVDDNEYTIAVKKKAASENTVAVTMCNKLEAEIAIINDENEKQEMLESLGIAMSGLNRMIKESFSLLDLITFLTSGEKESRAWTISKNTNAKNAAGKIHSDIEKGFIRAEVISYKDFVDCEGRSRAKTAGKIRMEGKDYIVKDGDVMLFLHKT